MKVVSEISFTCPHEKCMKGNEGNENGSAVSMNFVVGHFYPFRNWEKNRLYFVLVIATSFPSQTSFREVFTISWSSM